MNITDIRALLYVPESRPGFFEQSREGESGIALYCRKVLIQNKTENIAPKWMRFVKGKAAICLLFTYVKTFTMHDLCVTS